MGLVSAREIIPASDVGDRHLRAIGAPVALPADGRYCVGGVSRVIGIDEKSRVAKNFTEYSLVGSDDRQAGMLNLEQRKTQALITRCRDEKIAGFDDRAGLMIAQWSVQCHVRLPREPIGISAPPNTPDKVQMDRHAEAPSYRAADLGRRPQILAGLDRPDGDHL